MSGPVPVPVAGPPGILPGPAAGFIDLGLRDRRGGASPARGGSDRTTRPTARRGPAARHRVWTVISLAALIVVLATGAAVPGGSPPARLVGTIDATDAVFWFATGDLLYVERGGTGRGELYHLGDRVTLWASGPELTLFGRYGGTVLTTQACDGGRLAVSGLDARTGAPLWRRAGDPVGAAPGYLLLAQAQPDCAAGTAAGAPASEVIDVVDTVTGQTLWTARTAPDPSPVLVTDASGRQVLLAIDATGRWARHDARTGAILAPVGVPAPPRSQPLPLVTGVTVRSSEEATPQFRSLTTLTALPQAVVLFDFGSGSPTVRAVDPTTLAPLWIRAGLATAAVVLPCAGSLCLSDGSSTLALRADTGEVRWSAGWIPARLVGSRWALVAPPGGFESMPGRLRLLDLTDGRQVADLASWRLPGYPLTTGGRLWPDATPILYRYAAGRTWFGRLDPGNGVLWPRLVGSVSDRYTRCDAAGIHVTCGSADSLAVWRIPSVDDATR